MIIGTTNDNTAGILMGTMGLRAALVLATITTGTSTGVSAASTQVMAEGIVVRTAGSSASITFGDAGDLEFELDGIVLRVQGRVTAAGSLALVVNGETVPLPDGPIDLSIKVGSFVPVTAVVRHGALSSATLTFSRIDGQITVSSSVTSTSGSSSSASAGTSATRR